MPFAPGLRRWLRYLRTCIQLLSVLAAFASGRAAHAYPQYIGYGYSSCLTCHYNPLGNGPLTDYGRALGATTIAGRPPFISKEITDEKLGEYSGFLGRQDLLPDWLRLAFAYRGLDLFSSLERNEKTRWITMQEEGSIILQFMDQKLYFVSTMGYIPAPQSGAALTSTGESVSTFISREHYAAYRYSKNLGFYVGFMDPAFGIRVPDHEDFLRSTTFNNQNDQVHAIQAHYVDGKFEGAAQLMLGNLYQDSALRQKGVTFTGEYEVHKDVRLGASAWYTSSSFRKREQAELHARIGFPEGSALLAQFGINGDNPNDDTSLTQTQGYYFIQPHIRLIRGLEFLPTFQYFTNQLFKAGARTLSYGPALMWIPLQRLEFRADLIGSRTSAPDSAAYEDYSFLAQVRLWL